MTSSPPPPETPETPDTAAADATVACVVYRCRRQPEMYLYLREDLDPDGDTLPAALRERTGRLEEVMRLELHPQRRLARVDVARVLAALADSGWFLQLPPPELMANRLHFGD